MSGFVHLHNHTHYSLQDAACTVESLVKAAVKYEQPALALTDHGVVYGLAEFYKKAYKSGIKPILGMEAYIVVDGSRFDKGDDSEKTGKKKSKHYNHLVLLAKDNTGYKNLNKLSSIGFQEGFYYRPRIDMEVLNKYKDGLICTSACIGGVVSVHLVNDNYDKAKEVAVRFQEIFGDDFYLEIQDHGLEHDRKILEGMPKLSRELGIKLVATNDIHYVEKDHAYAHNILLLLADKNGEDYKNLRYKTDQIYFKSSEEMKELFKAHPDSISNTLEIADKVDSKISFGGLHFPVFPIPKESSAKTLDDYFEQLSLEGLKKRYEGNEITPEIQERFNYEIDVIKSMGYSGYFLIVQDFINAAKDMGVPVGPGRGSAAGSLVAYALRITNVNPLDYALLFERFLNPARQSMPDIDVDFADDQRGEVIDYVKGKYGEDAVCQIVTFNTLSSKAVLKDVARVLKIPIPTVTNITKYIPSKFGKVYSIEQAIDEVPELKWLKKTDDELLLDLIKYGKILEGMNRNNSKHAAGVVIAPGPISDYVATAFAGGSKDLVTQYNMKELEASAGLLKMDFLGLRTLTIIRDTITLIKQTRNIDLDIDSIPLDDPKTYELFSKGQTTAIFQFESGPMREYLKNLQPNSISDLSAMNALYRPGPMEFINDFIDRKFGRSPVVYLHPVLESILKETYGIIVYQEQVIQIANKVAGMSLAEADILRRAMGKKDLKAMAEQRLNFVDGAVKNNIDKKIAEDIFDAIDKFANYGFNKSHSVAYSFVAYQTAYLKAHFLPEFLAANLTNEYHDTNKVTVFLEDCRKLKVDVLAPNVNKPSVHFNVDNGKIIFGMCAIKNVGEGAVEEIVRVRAEIDRDFKTIYDLCSLVDTRVVNKRVLEGLIQAGALDELEGSRATNFAAIEEALSYGSKIKTMKETQVDNLFGSADDDLDIPEPALPDISPWSEEERLARERQVLGFYLSNHPLRKYEAEFNSFATIKLGETEDLTDEKADIVRACGVVTEFKTKLDKSGKTMAFFRLDDLTGSCECLMFSKTFEKYGDCVREEATVIVKGKPESSGDAIKLQIEEVYELAEAKNLFADKIGIYIDEKQYKPDLIKNLKEILASNNGDKKVIICVTENGRLKNKFYLDRYKVKFNDSFIDGVKKVVGEENYRFSN